MEEAKKGTPGESETSFIDLFICTTFLFLIFLNCICTYGLKSRVKHPGVCPLFFTQLTDQCESMQMGSLMFSTQVTPEPSCRLNASFQIHISSLGVSVKAWVLNWCLHLIIKVQDYLIWNI